MIRHLSQADFRSMPWANGKGVTIELARQDQDGALLWRLSRASVVEAGDFSLFPGIERNLTVLTGPGFDLVGPGLSLTAAPLSPVAFPGDVPVRAENVTAPSDDFNVMTARALPRPQVRVLAHAAPVPALGLTALYALAECQVSGRALAMGDLLLADTALELQSGQALVVQLL